MEACNGDSQRLCSQADIAANHYGMIFLTCMLKYANMVVQNKEINSEDTIQDIEYETISSTTHVIVLTAPAY